MAGVQPPKSPTLFPPRKSVELEDPGAHDLDSSNDEGDVFSDAQDGHQPPDSATHKIHFKKNSVTDGLAVIAEGSQNEIATRAKGQALSLSAHGLPIPMTVVEKVHPAEPSHGDVPGTAAHEMRKADAVPDAILRAPSPGEASQKYSRRSVSPATIPIPKTVITKVDFEPRHGEVPGTDAYKIRTEDAIPDLVEEKGDVPSWPTSSIRSKIHQLSSRFAVEGNSPIAEDGGFGPMTYDDEDDDDEDNDNDEDRDNTTEEGYKHDNSHQGNGSSDQGDEFASDFDDFEQGAEADDFGDFDKGSKEDVVAEEAAQHTAAKNTSPSVTCPYPILDFSTLKTLDDIIEATSPHLSALFPLASRPRNPPAPVPPESNSVFLTERSLSLWSQLVDPPPLQPPNWTRSRIRRLFLVSLGVPVDLDEILPASKQKKLILPYTPSESTNTKEHRKGSVARLKQSDANASTTSLDSTSDRVLTPAAGSSSKSSSRRRKGPPPPPEFNVVVARRLCATTDAELESMNDEELKTHEARLEDFVQRGKQVLQYWIGRKEGAVGDKEAFDGVIENLVRHARRVRK